jgi:hypothetical protein
MSPVIASSDLMALLLPRVPHSAAAKQCYAAFRSAAVESVVAGRVRTADLLRTYTVRLARNPGAVLGSDRLLSDLRDYAGANLLLAVLEWKGRVFCVLCDTERRHLVACFVGDDRRAGDLPEASWA